jgi:hypothetical protein
VLTKKDPFRFTSQDLIDRLFLAKVSGIVIGQTQINEFHNTLPAKIDKPRTKSGTGLDHKTKLS